MPQRPEVYLEPKWLRYLSWIEKQSHGESNEQQVCQVSLQGLWVKAGVVYVLLVFENMCLNSFVESTSVPIHLARAKDQGRTCCLWLACVWYHVFEPLLLNVEGTSVPSQLANRKDQGRTCCVWVACVWYHVLEELLLKAQVCQVSFQKARIMAEAKSACKSQGSRQDLLFICCLCLVACVICCKHIFLIWRLSLYSFFLVITFADGHTVSNAPDLFRPPQLSGTGPG